MKLLKCLVSLQYEKSILLVNGFDIYLAIEKLELGLNVAISYVIMWCQFGMVLHVYGFVKV